MLKSQNLPDTFFFFPERPRYGAGFTSAGSLELFPFYFLLASSKLILSFSSEPRKIKQRYFILA